MTNPKTRAGALGLSGTPRRSQIPPEFKAWSSCFGVRECPPVSFLDPYNGHSTVQFLRLETAQRSRGKAAKTVL